ncbi:MAG: tetratricopeptide repeat protein, partial [Gemmatimonadaceae bacterium]
GAPDEAARALSTALKHLKGRDRDEGTILLAETLQEMADWKGSLEVLADVERKKTIDPRFAELRDVMLVDARRGLSLNSVKERRELANALIRTLPQLSCPDAFLRSALVAAKIATGLRCSSVAQSLRECIASYPTDGLNSRLKAMHALVSAMAAYQAGDAETSLSILQRTVPEIDEAGLGDSTAAMLHVGLGVVCGWNGDYSQAARSSERALTLAERLDNQMIAAIAAANLAVFHLRLGNYSKANDFGELAYQRALTQPLAEFDRIRASYFIGMASAFNGTTERAQKAIERLQIEVARTELPWVRQIGHLYLADLNWLVGNRRAAIRSARAAVGLSRAPMASAATGVFARWLAHLVRNPGHADLALQLLQGLAEHETQLDRLDRIELSASIMSLQGGLAMVAESRAAQVRQELAQLPLAVSHQLTRLGVLTSGGGSKPLPEALL